MCSLYGRRAVGDTSLPLVQSLRRELYSMPSAASGGAECATSVPRQGHTCTPALLPSSPFALLPCDLQVVTCDLCPVTCDW